MNLRGTNLLVGFGWVLAGLALYFDLLLLELDWNLRSWQPTLDPFAVSLVLGLPAVLAAFWFLAAKRTGRLNRALSLILCLGLAALAVYVSARETMTEGMLAREIPSPLWYRGGRFVVLCLPGVFWASRIRHRESNRNSRSQEDLR